MMCHQHVLFGLRPELEHDVSPLASDVLARGARARDFAAWAACRKQPETARKWTSKARARTGAFSLLRHATCPYR